MNSKNSRLIWIFLGYDIALIIVSFLSSIYLKYDSFEPGKYYVMLPLILISWAGVVLGFKSQNYQFRDGLIERLRKQFVDFIFFVGIVSTLVLVLELKLYSRLVLFGTSTLFFTLRNVGFILLYKYLGRMRSKGRHVKRLLIIGAGRIGKQLDDEIRKDIGLGYKVLGFLDDNPGGALVSTSRIHGRLEDLENIIVSQRVEEIIIAIPLPEKAKIADILEKADFHGLRIGMVPDYFRVVERPFESSMLAGLPIVRIREIALDGFTNQAVKRMFDIVFSLCVLVILLPLFLVLGILVKASSRGPVFYVPARIGLGGKEFGCLKFRSMVVDDSKDHNLKSTVVGDSRITKTGIFLRKYSLDELPQFINVLLGEMSVVGPRPHRAFLNEDMQKKVEGYMLRHYIKPGITGWAQVNGWRGPTETLEQKEQRTNHDLWYIDNWSFWLDIRIVLLTLIGKSGHNAF
jgi:Undecaprenyl-phosphate glucose phosphotransferase